MRVLGIRDAYPHFRTELQLAWQDANDGMLMNLANGVRFFGYLLFGLWQQLLCYCVGWAAFVLTAFAGMLRPHDWIAASQTDGAYTAA